MKSSSIVLVAVKLKTSQIFLSQYPYVYYYMKLDDVEKNVKTLRNKYDAKLELEGEGGSIKTKVFNLEIILPEMIGIYTIPASKFKREELSKEEIERVGKVVDEFCQK